MKRISGIILTAIIILITSFSNAAGQDKKSEEKIKIIIENGSGTRVVIDTVFKDNNRPDSIKLKDGTVIFLEHPGNETDLRHHKGKEHFFITYSGDGKEDGRGVKEMTIISSDSLHFKHAGDSDDVIYNVNSDSVRVNSSERSKIITWTSKNHGDNKETIYIHKGRRPSTEIENTFNVYDSDSDSDSNVEKSRYVIAKDGMVVTVEGRDEAKTKELVKEIQDKLGINNDGTDKKEPEKTVTKKTQKK